ncbi:MAG: ribonuclease III [Bacteroidota bacterium]|nr:ribonuclease III [Bacteroidota bacterium]MDP4205166.1 ribonuclease III [Bacteroidota bacterium]
MFLKSLLGIYPSNLKLYDLAFVHKSASATDSRGFVINNERLEYLGDAILGAIIADFLYKRFPNRDEGFLTQMRSKLVNRSFLTQLTYQTGLYVFIQSHTNGNMLQSHIYGDAFEALIGAIYLDKGYSVTRQVVIRRILNRFVDLNEVENLNTNFKSQLIEWAQKHKKQVNFETHEEGGGTGKQTLFISIVEIDHKVMGKGYGSSKKDAQQNSAKEAFLKISK